MKSIRQNQRRLNILHNQSSPPPLDSENKLRKALCGLGLGLLLLAGGAPTAGANTALQFDGNDDYVTIPVGANSLDNATQWTLSAWIKWSGSGSSYQAVLSQPSDTDGTGVVLVVTQGVLCGGQNTSTPYLFNGLACSAAPTIVAGVCTHIAVTYDGSDFRVYKNAVEVGSSNQPGLQVEPTDQPFFIGVEGIGTPNLLPRIFSGTIDEASFWNVARTQAQIESSMNTGLVGNEAGLKAYYKFENGTGSSSLSDLTANGNTGTLTNMDTATAWVSSDCFDAVNQPPIANAGTDQSIHAGTPVNLNGGASFDDNTTTAALQYSWGFFSAPAGNTAVLNNATTATPSFTPNVTGEYVVKLIVTDNGTPSLSSDPTAPAARVTLSSFNQAATANPLLPYVGQTVSLNGTGSTDPDDVSLTYEWTVTSRPTGSVALLFGPTGSSTSFTPDVPGTYQVTLTVRDFLGAGSPAATVTFVASTASSFAESNIIAASTIVDGLLRSQVTNKGNQKEFRKLLRKAVRNSQKGHYCKAVSKLNMAIERTDGCPERGTPDRTGSGRDWITDCAVQQTVYGDLINARDALAGLPCGSPGEGADDEDNEDHGHDD